jgi:hypothetical protein
MKHLLLKSVFIVILFNLLSSCDPEAVNLSTQEELLTKKWRASQVLVDGVIQNSTDWENYFLEFFDSKTYTLNSNSVAETGSWALNELETEIIFDGGSFIYRIISLTTEELTVAYNLDNKSYRILFVPA